MRRRWCAGAYESLREGGLFLTAEPGSGHSQAESSVKIIELMGTTENDMPFACQKELLLAAGFSEVRQYLRLSELPLEAVSTEGGRAWQGVHPRGRARLPYGGAGVHEHCGGGEVSEQSRFPAVCVNCYICSHGMDGAIKQLQETVIVVAGLQARQAEVLQGHGEWLEQHERAMARHEEWLARHDMVMAEMDDKLNGLIAVVDDLVRHRKDE